MSLPLAGTMPGRVLVLARDPQVIATACDAARRVRRSATMLETGREALTLLTAPGRAHHQIVCDSAVASTACWPDLLAAASEQPGRAALLVVSDDPVGALPDGMSPVPPDSAAIAAALAANHAAGSGPALDSASLRGGLDRGEVSVRYQPMVRVSDRQPVMVEALARWTPGYPPVAPDLFLPLAASAGLMRPLSMSVARSAVQEIGAVRQQLRIGVTINLPLDLFHHRDLTSWLGRQIARSALRPEDIFFELTEHHEVHDRSGLARELRRMRQAGHGVLLDDIVLDDPRRELFGLDFSGLKLDRSLVTALSRSGRAREQVRRMVRGAEARGQIIVAEGVSHPMQMRMLADLGIDWVQGFLISRPLLGSALVGWSELWRARRPI